MNKIIIGKKKWLKLGAAAFLSIGMLSACGDGDDDDVDIDVNDPVEDVDPNNGPDTDVNIDNDDTDDSDVEMDDGIDDDPDVNIDDEEDNAS